MRVTGAARMTTRRETVDNLQKRSRTPCPILILDLPDYRVKHATGFRVLRVKCPKAIHRCDLLMTEVGPKGVPCFCLAKTAPSDRY